VNFQFDTVSFTIEGPPPSMAASLNLVFYLNARARQDNEGKRESKKKCDDDDDDDGDNIHRCYHLSLLLGELANSSRSRKLEKSENSLDKTGLSSKQCDPT